jgi:phospholipid-transporting ATPase
LSAALTDKQNNPSAILLRLGSAMMNKQQNLEPSLPNNWPKPTPEDIASKPNRIIILGDQQTYAFRNNFVKTSKYETWNFLPKFLMEEFNPRTKVANCYFLLVSILQTIPQISNTFGLPTTLIPLICVVVVDGVFALLEDIGRHRADTEANSSIGLVYSQEAGTFVEKKWADMAVGDFVKIRSREKIPADVIILGVAEKSQIPQGICYVETKSLDGETNLKLRTVVPNSLGIVSHSCLSLLS